MSFVSFSRLNEAVFLLTRALHAIICYLNAIMLFFTDLLPALDGDAKTLNFLQEVVDILLAYLVESFDRSTKVIDFHYPNELLQRNNWELSDEPETLDDILISCRATLKYAIKTGKRFHLSFVNNSLYSVKSGNLQLLP